jgi:hypothetical protein
MTYKWAVRNCLVILACVAMACGTACFCAYFGG